MWAQIFFSHKQWLATVVNLEFLTWKWFNFYNNSIYAALELWINNDKFDWTSLQQLRLPLVNFLLPNEHIGSTFWFNNIFYVNPIPPRLFSKLFPLGGGRHVSHPVELHTKIFLHQNFSPSVLRVSIADFVFEGPRFNSQ